MNILDLVDDISKNNIELANRLLGYISKISNGLSDMSIFELKNFLIKLSYEDIQLSYDLSFYLKDKTQYDNFFPKCCHYDKKVQTFNLTNYKNYITDKNQPYAQRYALYYYMYTVALNIIKDMNEALYVYKLLLKESKELLPLDITLNKESSEKRVFIYTNGYMPSKNAPSKVVTEWANSFLALNYKVIILSCTPTPYPYSLHIPIKWNRSTLKLEEIKELKPDLFHIAMYGDPTLNNFYKNFIEDMKFTTNDRVLLCGNACIHFDILPDNIDKYFIPIATDNIITTANNYILQKPIKLKNIYNKKMNFIKGPDSYENNLNVIFKPPVIKEDETINIVVVGNRLYLELDNDFFNAIKKVIKKIKRVKLYIVGEYNKEDIPSSLKENIILSGYQKDLVGFYRKMHFYLNPNRKGGGFSAIAAIKSGLPIITLPHGDVYFAIKKIYSIDSYDKIHKFINSYINNSKKKEKIDKLSHSLVELYKNDNKLIEAVKKIIK